MSRSVHDNHLTAFEVDGVERRIVLHTEYAYGEEPFEKTDVVFEGVLDHYFKNAVLPSIIFDVEEVDTHTIISRNKETIDEGHRIGGWPSFWERSVDAMVSKIGNAGGRVFEISSSYGMDGWVVAVSCEFKSTYEDGDNKSWDATGDKPAS